MTRLPGLPALLVALVACAPVGEEGGGGPSAAVAEPACREALVEFHGIADVRVLGSEPAAAGTRAVRASVLTSSSGSREIWACTAGPDGVAGDLRYVEADPDAGPAFAGGRPSRAEQLCLVAVTRETKNLDVVLLGSEASEAGTRVLVGVGEAQAPWQCFAYRDGSTGRVGFLGSEGTL